MLNCQIGLLFSYQVFCERTRLPKAVIARREWKPFGDALSSDNKTRTATTQENIFIEDPKASGHHFFDLHCRAMHIVSTCGVCVWTSVTSFTLVLLLLLTLT